MQFSAILNTIQFFMKSGQFPAVIINTSHRVLMIPLSEGKIIHRHIWHNFSAE